jgi:YVTN family beta-propeller protein
MTADAEPVLNAVNIPGLGTRAAAGSEAYVCNFAYDSDPGDTVTPVDLSAAKVDPRVTTGSLPSAVAATPNGRMILVTDEGEDELTVLDSTDAHVIATIATGAEPDAVAISPNGVVALVANSDDGTVTPVVLATMHADPPIRVGGQPDAIAIGGTTGQTALVANSGTGTVTALDLATMSVERTITVGEEPDGIAMKPDGTSALVANLGSNSVTLIDMTTLKAVQTVALQVPPTGIATAKGGNPAAWVTGGKSVEEVTFDGPALVHSANIRHLAEAIAVDGAGDEAWVADGDGYVTEVDLRTGMAGKSVDVGGRPTAIVIPPAIRSS